MPARIQTGATERIEFAAEDGAGDPLTGKTDIVLSIRRVSDGQFFDFADLTFKAAGWTTRQQTLAEVDATNAAGDYYYDFDTATITNPTADDTYMLRAEQSPKTDCANSPFTDELKVGQYVDDIDASIAAVKAKTDNLPVDPADESNQLAQHSATQAAIAALNDLSQADVQSAMTAQGYTTARAPNLDNLDSTVSSRAMPSDIINDATPFAGADVAAILADTAAMDTRLPADPADESNQLAAHTTTQAAIAALNDLSQVDVQAAMTAQGYTAARAPNLDNLDAAVSTRATPADVLTQLGTYGAATGAQVATRAAPGDAMDLVADAVDAAALAASAVTEIDSALSSAHGAGSWEGSTATAVATAVWNEALPGAFGAGSAGKIVGDDLDATVSSRAAPGAAMALTTGAVDALWDEDIVAAHGAADTAGLLLRALGAMISQRANNPTLEALLGVADVAGNDVPEQLSTEHGAGDWRSAPVIDLLVAAQTAAVAGSTATQIRTGLTQVDDFFNNMQVVVVNVAGVAARNIDDYQQVNGAIIVSALPFAPAPGDIVVVLARTGSVPVDVAAIVDGVYSESLPGGYIGNQAGNMISDILIASEAVDTRLPSDPADESLLEAEIANLAGAGYVQGTDSLKAAHDQRVSLQASVDDISNVTRFGATIPLLERPSTGTIGYRLRVNLEDTAGNPEDPDADTISISVVNHAGVSRDANLSAPTMTKLSTGRYDVVYNVADTHALEQLIFTFAYAENGVSFAKDKSTLVTDSAEVGFTATDRATLNATAIEANVESHVQTGLTTHGYTSVRAGKIDRLDVNVSTRSSHTPADVDSQLSGAHGAGAWGGSGDWTAGEREQIREALGVDGTKTTAVGGQLQDVLTDTSAIDTRLPSDPADQSLITASIAALNDLSQAGVQAAMTSQGYTAARAPKLDNLDTNVGSRAAPGAAMDLVTNAINSSSVATSGAQEIRDSILIDSTPFAGAQVATILAHAAAIDSRLPTLPANETTQLLQHATTQAAIAAIDLQSDMTAQGYTAARAIKLDNLDAAVSSRATPGAAMDLITDAVDAAALATSAVNEIRDSLITDATPFAGADIALIKAKTNNLPADPASQTGVSAAEAAIRGGPDTLDSLSDQLDAVEVNAQAHAAAALAAYDGPTRAEATGDKDEIIDEINKTQIRFGAVYDETPDTLYVEVTAERHGQPVTVADLVSATIAVYDADDNLVFTLVDVAPDTLGVFRATKTAPGLVADRLYYARVTVVTTSDTAVGNRGFQTTL